MSDNVFLLDIGNSRGKWMLLEGEQLQRRGAGPVAAILEELADELSAALVLIASVASEADNAALAQRLDALGARSWFARSRAEAGGLVNSYAEPERMGVDRWLAMLAAYRRAGRRVCVIDAGSALTIDLVADDGRHEGGYIIPGAALMQRALLSDTDRVRFDDSVAPSLTPGCSTAEAVGNGILLAQVGAVNTALSEVMAVGVKPACFLCGGGSAELEPALDALALDVVNAPDLVFEGLLIQARALAVLAEVSELGAAEK